MTKGEVHTLDWSPDNQHVAYTKQNQIVIYNTATHKVLTIHQRVPRNVQWFPNGTQLLYEAPDERGLSQLFRININGSGKQQITNNQQGPLNHVRLSPDGRYVLYTTPGSKQLISGQISYSKYPEGLL
ncbi:TolB family protein [Salirhabdus salicampi]|uniref:TolB family protein n=1 Tax=Salirhabdus salicampi TaxID=476102 RepID=UPI0020C25293|nr:hypothetical protein [Salirhabdus salicampi]MCP8616282.1 hypothetical protein [Salirhabdus salicampi]